MSKVWSKELEGCCAEGGTQNKEQLILSPQK